MSEEIALEYKVYGCPICKKQNSFVNICVTNEFNIFNCKNCGVDFVGNPPTTDELTAYYDRAEWFEGGEYGGYEDYDKQTESGLIRFQSVLEEYSQQKGLSILDIGCGYGNHLALAAERGWKCFGIEPSAHARQVASSRLGASAVLVAAISDLIPHEFDLILMLDVIEHVSSPYELFYELFSIGAIVPKTRIIITTPNAGSKFARENPAEWAYRHPPSHLVFYTAESLKFLLARLQFTEISVKGTHPIDGFTEHNNLLSYDGLEAQASGSNFTEFMRERYVPGTWSKIAEYEHIPRYKLACLFAEGKNVLDFGCGTGYGSAMLSKVAENVIGIDIDNSANEWACNTHHNSNLKFHLCDDLGDSLPAGSFDLVTCFEMIEHVDHKTQIATISSISKLLKNDGLLIISTPNPEVTKLYGENPYHLREMDEFEFFEILKKYFYHVKIIKQKVRVGISFEDQGELGEYRRLIDSSNGHTKEMSDPIAFLAICSNDNLPKFKSFLYFDEADYINDFLNKEKKINESKLLAYSTSEMLTLELDSYRSQAVDYSQQVASLQEKLNMAQSHIGYLESALAQKTSEISSIRFLYKQLFKLILSKLINV